MSGWFISPSGEERWSCLFDLWESTKGLNKNGVVGFVWSGLMLCGWAKSNRWAWGVVFGPGHEGVRVKW